MAQYKERYLRDKASVPRFTQYMIAIVNNCQRFRELAQVFCTGFVQGFFEILKILRLNIKILRLKYEMSFLYRS